MELWQLHLSQPPSTESLWAVWDATVHLNSEELAPGWKGNLKHPPEAKETSESHLPSPVISDSMAEEEWHHSHCAHTGKMGGLSVSLTHFRVRGGKGDLKPGKDSLLKECTQRSQKSSSVESQSLKLLLSGPYFLKLDFESWYEMLQFMQANCEFQSRLMWSHLSGKPRLPVLLPAASYKEKDGKKHPKYIFWQNNKGICDCCFFQG